MAQTRMSFASILDRLRVALDQFREWNCEEPDPARHAFRIGPEDMAEFDAAAVELATHPDPSGERAFCGIRVILAPGRRPGVISLDNIEEKREPLVSMQDVMLRTGELNERELVAVRWVRDFYERMIDEGRLRGVEEVCMNEQGLCPCGEFIWYPCDVSGTPMIPKFCPNCGSKIKR